MRGNYVAGKSVFLANRFYAGQPGYDVLTAFKLKSTNEIVIVSRGWTALGSDPNKLPDLDTPSAEIEPSGVIQVPSGPSFFVDQPMPAENWPLRLNHLNVDRIAPFFAAPVFPYVVGLDEAMPGVLIHSVQAPDMHAERSTSYAVQWFAMALLLLLGSLFGCTNIAAVMRPKKR